MTKKSELPENVQWLRDKAKSLILPLSVFLPVSYFYSIDRYVRIRESYLVDSTPPMVRGVVAGCFWLMLLMGLFTIPRWHSWLAFASLAASSLLG
jgi:hypothetical protein